MNILKGMRRQHWQRKMEKSLGRRSDNDVLPVEGVARVIGMLFAVAFLRTNFIAWNFHFPTPTERLLWRISSSGLMAIVWVGGFYAASLYSDNKIKVMQKNIQQHRRALKDQGFSGKKENWKDRLVHKIQVIAMNIRNNSLENDPNFDVSLSFVLVGVPAFAVYTVFRVYILLEDVIAFRALPAGAYNTIN